MSIKFFKTKEPYGGFSNFSRHEFWLDGENWPTSEHYFQANKYPRNSQHYADVHNAATPRIAADIGRDRARPLRSDWEQVKDDIMRKCVLKKFQVHEDLRKMLLETGDQEIIEDSPFDSYWGIGPEGTGKNMLGKILVETREYLKEYTHCMTCGTTHRIKEDCPMNAFSIVTCSCGNESLMPCDALFGLKGMYCGQCNKDTDWKVTEPTMESMQRHWKDYGKDRS